MHMSCHFLPPFFLCPHFIQEVPSFQLNSEIHLFVCEMTAFSFTCSFKHTRENEENITLIIIKLFTIHGFKIECGFIMIHEAAKTRFR